MRSWPSLLALSSTAGAQGSKSDRGGLSGWLCAPPPHAGPQSLVQLRMEGLVEVRPAGPEVHLSCWVIGLCTPRVVVRKPGHTRLFRCLPDASPRLAPIGLAAV
ncbi:unnamed protein product [Rangifer tarandus platyrhynchus]|uniref:Uncharacterized protein n=1 Tax=Rangifer tarandus platyrhynchus TaxID=3082113 RepID=A0AC59Y9K9_RANTA